MPELPEIEVLKISLHKYINKTKILKVKIRNRYLRYKIPKNFEKKLIGNTISSIERRSKYIILNFENKKKLFFHLGMSGVIFLKKKKKNFKIKTSFYSNLNFSNKHDHIEITFSNKYILVYNDPRRFGFFKFFKKDINFISNFKNLGPEPLSKNFTKEYLEKILKFKKRNIKNLLMDQRAVCGLGNIYVNESLFKAKIIPTRSCLSIKEYEIKDLIKNIKLVLKRSISLGGSSIKNYKNLKGHSGRFQDKFMVYGREGLKCLRNRCNGMVKKINISNRSSFFCSDCQI